MHEILDRHSVLASRWWCELYEVKVKVGELGVEKVDYTGFVQGTDITPNLHPHDLARSTRWSWRMLWRFNHLQGISLISPLSSLEEQSSDRHGRGQSPCMNRIPNPWHSWHGMGAERKADLITGSPLSQTILIKCCNRTWNSSSIVGMGGSDTRFAKVASHCPFDCYIP